MKKVKRLDDDAKGMWNVQTETSSYILDMDNRKAMRVPNTGAGIHPDYAKDRIVLVVPLPADNEWFYFSTLKQCEVGELMFIWEGSHNGMRRSTIVMKIQKVVPNESGS